LEGARVYDFEGSDGAYTFGHVANGFASSKNSSNTMSSKYEPGGSVIAPLKINPPARMPEYRRLHCEDDMATLDCGIVDPFKERNI
jgi:hypothetical protein